MSYEIVKNISHDKKNNKIFITSASNNLWPRTYSRWEFMPDKEGNKNKNKELYLFHGIIGGSYQLSGSVNENWKYAENKFYEYCKNNNIDIYDLLDLPYKNKNEFNIEVLKPYYEIFKKYLEEKKEGKYYLDSNVGIIIKINKNNFKSTYNIDESKKYSKSFKKAFNDLCKFSPRTREQYNISIKEYEKNKTLDELCIS